MKRMHRAIRGTALTETLIILPIFLMLALGAMQFSFIYEAKSTLNYATFMAARAGAIDHAQQNSISMGLARSLAPLYSPDKNAAGLAKTIARVRGELAVFSKISILNPTTEAFNDFAVQDPKTGKKEIPNEMLHVASTKVGGSSGVNIQDANLLKVQVLYGYKLQVPFVNKVITTITSWFTTDPVKLLYLSQGRLPILATSTVRMQSRAWKNGWMQTKKTVEDAVDNAGKPSNPLPIAYLKRPWESGPTGGDLPTPEALAYPPNDGVGSGTNSGGADSSDPSNTDGNNSDNSGDNASSPVDTESNINCESRWEDERYKSPEGSSWNPLNWPGKIRAAAAAVWDFMEGVLAGLGDQVKDLWDLLKDPTVLYDVAKAFADDPKGTITAMVQGLGEEVQKVLECGPKDIGRVIGNNINPATPVKILGQLAKVTKSQKLAKYADDLDKRMKCASFAAGTPIWTSHGLQNIETLRTNVMVLSRDDTNFSDREQVITETFGRKVTNYYQLHTEREVFQVTEEHPLWVQGKGWIPVKYVVRGDAVATKDGDTLVLSTTLVEEPLRVYNFSVANTPSYFVGREGVWVHNAKNGINCIDNSTKLSKETYDILTFDPDKGRHTAGAVEELRAALAAEKDGKIGKVVERGKIDSGVDFITSTGDKIDVKAPRGDYLVNRQQALKLKGSIDSDPGLKILLDIRNLKSGDLEVILQRADSVGIPRDKFIIPDTNSYNPIQVGDVLY